jgi:hypothetical protein
MAGAMLVNGPVSCIGRRVLYANTIKTPNSKMEEIKESALVAVTLFLTFNSYCPVCPVRASHSSSIWLGFGLWGKVLLNMEDTYRGGDMYRGGDTYRGGDMYRAGEYRDVFINSFVLWKIGVTVFTPVFKAWSSSGDPVVTLRRSNILGGSGSSDVGQVLLSTIEVCWLSSYRSDKSLMTFANNADIDLGGCAKMLPRFPIVVISSRHQSLNNELM